MQALPVADGVDVIGNHAAMPPQAIFRPSFPVPLSLAADQPIPLELARGHELFRYGTLVYCNLCACRSAGSRARNLRLRCRGSPSGPAQASRLANLRGGRHPDDPTQELSFPRVRVTVGDLSDIAGLAVECLEQSPFSSLLLTPLASDDPGLVDLGAPLCGIQNEIFQAKVRRLLASASYSVHSDVPSDTHVNTGYSSVGTVGS